MRRRQPQQLAKLLRYILGHRPDEFGLLPTPDGFIPLKDLHQALKEEEDWSYVRLADIQEVLMIQAHRFEVVDNQIRLHPHEISRPPIDPAPAVPPQLLYFGARQKAYPHILRKGLYPTRYPYVCLASQAELALRMGRRRDPKPVVITVQAAKAHETGIRFSRVRELLYLVDFLPPTYLEGPSVPREKPRPQRSPETRLYQPAGSFELDLESIPKRLKREKQKRWESWKKDAKRYRKTGVKRRP